MVSALYFFSALILMVGWQEEHLVFINKHHFTNTHRFSSEHMVEEEEDPKKVPADPG